MNPVVILTFPQGMVWERHALPGTRFFSFVGA